MRPNQKLAVVVFVVVLVVALLLLHRLAQTPQEEASAAALGATASANIEAEPAIARSVLPGSNGATYAGIPRSHDRVRILSNTGYIVGYSDEKKTPLWSAFRIFAAPNPPSPRPRGFKVDHRVRAVIHPDDYLHSGYDRGHLAPSDAIHNCYGDEAKIATYLMSNIIPQRPQLNRQVWFKLERFEWDALAEVREVWVVTGPVYTDDRKLASGVPVPSACFRILLDEVDGRNPRVLAFLIPQDVRGDEPFHQFLVAVDKIERVSGVDVFHELDDAVEAPLESAVPTMW